jgi:Fanconi-associated nuclease 1
VLTIIASQPLFKKMIQTKISFKRLEKQPENTRKKIKTACIDLDLNSLYKLNLVTLPEEMGYVAQMDTCIRSVLEVESHLVESKFLLSFLALPENAKLLYIRLFNRKLKWMRVEKLKYPESEKNQQLIRDLEQLNLVETTGPDTPQGWFHVLLKEDLIQLNTTLNTNQKGSKNKQDLINQLINIDSDLVMKTIKAGKMIKLNESKIKQAGKMIKLNESKREIFQKCFVIYQRLLMWPENDAFMTTSILANLTEGHKRPFVATNFIRTELFWPTRLDFEDYFTSLKLYNSVLVYLDSKTDDYMLAIEIYKHQYPQWISSLKFEHITGISWFSLFTKASILTRMMDKICRAFFRLKDYKSCVDLLSDLLNQRNYCLQKRGHWYDELAKILELYVDKSRASLVCKQALSDTYVMTQYRASIIKRLTRLCKNKSSLPCALWNLKDKNAIRLRTIKAKYLESDSNRVQILGKSNEPICVEDFALDYYASFGWKGCHTESSIIFTLFGILFWDIIFDDSVPGVFNSTFQSGPLDLNTEYFYEARKDRIDKRILEIAAGFGSKIVEIVSGRELERKTVCAGVNWRDYSAEDLVLFVECIGKQPLSLICTALAKYYWAYRGGVPDLFLYKAETKECMFVEVKSENDRLSSSQIEWMDDLKSWKIPVETLKVIRNR